MKIFTYLRDLLRSLSPLGIGTLFISLFIFSLYLNWLDNSSHNLENSTLITAENLTAKKNIELSFEQGENKPSLTFDDPPESLRSYSELVISLPESVKSGVLEIQVNPRTRFSARNVIKMRALSVRGGAEKLARDHITSKWIILGNQDNIYHFPLRAKSNHDKVVLQVKGHIKKLHIDSIRLIPSTVYDYPFGTILTCLLVSIIMFLPGLIIFSLFGSVVNLPASFISFVYSLPIHISALGFSIWTEKLNLYWLFLLLLTATAAAALKLLKQTIVINRADLFKCVNQLFLLTAFIALALAYISPASMKNAYFPQTSSAHTFGVFTAHDSTFQYRNGKAIVEKSFAKYYDLNKKRGYKPQDREILPGLNYASVILGLEPILGEKVAKTYIPYVFYYLMCHCLIFFLIKAWLKPYGESTSSWIAIFILTSPALWILNMIGWFKLTGAAMILAAMFAIKEKPDKLGIWIFAGILLGLSKNYHGANALCFPLLVLWMLWRAKVSCPDLSLKRLATLFISLTSITCIIMMIWPLYVSQAWGTGTHRLFAQHYLGNNFDPNSLAESIKLFFQSVPWSEQSHIRTERMESMFSKNQGMKEGLELYAYSSNGWVELWLKASSAFILPAIWPYLLIAILFRIFDYIHNSDSYNNEQIISLKTNKWYSQFGLISFMTLLMVGYISYGPEKAFTGIIWHLPPIAIIGLLLWIVQFSIRSDSSKKLWSYLAVIQLTIVSLNW